MMDKIWNKTLTIRAFITVLFILMVSVSCSVANYEGTLRKTRIYVGKYSGAESVSQKETIILTTDIVVTIDTRHNSFVDTIPHGTLCYIDLNPCKFDYHPDIAYQLDSQYLVFLTDTENPIRYRVIKNHRFY